MKKLVLSICILASLVSTANAQAPANMGLEAWSTIPFNSIKDPDNWASFNALNVAGMNQTVFQETAAPYELLSSARISTEKIPAGTTIPGYDTVGLLVLGAVIPSFPPAIKYGRPYDDMPASMTFAMKYIPNGLDTGFVLVQLTKYNTVTHKADTITSARYQTSATINSWTTQSINLGTYIMQPDTLKIYCSSSSLYRPKIGSNLFVDDFKMIGWVGVDELNGVKNSVSVFPNPASNNITIQSGAAAAFTEIADITGRAVGSYKMQNNAVNIETYNFPSGMYFFAVKDEKGQILNRGKFEVSK